MFSDRLMMELWQRLPVDQTLDKLMSVCVWVCVLLFYHLLMQNPLPSLLCVFMYVEHTHSSLNEHITGDVCRLCVGMLNYKALTMKDLHSGRYGNCHGYHHLNTSDCKTK